MMKMVAPLGVAAAALLALAVNGQAQDSTAGDDTAATTEEAVAVDDAMAYVPLASDGGLGTGVAL